MTKNLLALIVLINLVGCSSKTPFEMAQEGPTMKDNYNDHIAGVKPVGRSLPTGQLVGSQSISRAAENDVNQGEQATARRAVNPELQMFVFPHRATKQGVIIPGYYVNFPMYDKVHYTLGVSE